MSRKAVFYVGLLLVLIVAFFVTSAFVKFTKNANLNAAARSGDLNACKELLSRGADVNGRGMHGMLPIMSAAEGGHAAVVEYLVSVGADVDGHNTSGSALMWAVDSQDEATVRVLLQHGANADWRNHLNETALDHAEINDLVRIVEILRETK